MGTFVLTALFETLEARCVLDWGIFRFFSKAIETHIVYSDEPWYGLQQPGWHPTLQYFCGAMYGQG